MKVEEIDKRLSERMANVVADTDYYDATESPVTLHGGFYENESGFFVRVPTKTAENISRGIRILGKITAGMRIKFSTDSDYLELKVGYSSYFHVTKMSFLASSGFTLLEDTDDGQCFAQIFIPEEEDKKGFCQRKPLKGGKVRNYTLYFPMYNDMKSVVIGVKKGAYFGSGKAYKQLKPILWYGSSVTQGCCVSRSDNAYSALVSKKNNIDFINLGFSGNAKAEPVMRKFLASFDSSLFICEYDYNSETEELIINHPLLYREYRDKHPSVPILFVTRADTDGNEETTALRRDIILKTYNEALNNGDKNVYYIDGSALFGDADREKCTIDGCHPNDLGNYRIFEKLYETLGAIDKKFL